MKQIQRTTDRHTAPNAETLTRGFAKLLLIASVSFALDATAAPASLDGTHVHGLAYDPAAPDRLLIATHHGLFAVEGGELARVSATADDFMGFTVRPDGALIASGHPVAGGNLGVISSDDGGRAWRHLSDGANGPVDFHHLAASSAALDLMVGTFGGLQISRDGGETWKTGAALPAPVFGIALSPVEPETLYIATEAGLLVSSDLGSEWTTEHAANVLVTMVTVGPDGALYVYDLASGLSVKRPGSSVWEVIGAPLQDDAIAHFAAGEEEFAAATYRGLLFRSRDSGSTWEPLLD